jgi:ABC-2 type transport system permease protein
MLSKVLAMTLVILAATALAMVTVLKPVFGVPIKGSVSLFFLVTMLYSFTIAGLGLFAATVTKNHSAGRYARLPGNFADAIVVEDHDTV